MSNSPILKEIDYKAIHENTKSYLVFKISITTNLIERLAYLDVLNYLERIELEWDKKGGRKK